MVKTYCSTNTYMFDNLKMQLFIQANIFVNAKCHMALIAKTIVTCIVRQSYIEFQD